MSLAYFTGLILDSFRQHGETALMRASAMGYHEIAELLLADAEKRRQRYLTADDMVSRRPCQFVR